MKYFIFATHPAYATPFLIGKGTTPEQVVHQAKQRGIPAIPHTCREITYTERYRFAGHIDVDLLPGCRAKNGMIV